MIAHRQAQPGRIVLAFASLAFLSSTAHANMGTTLMWAGAFHLIVGNAIIGVVEGLILARITGARRGIACGLAIVANYASMIVGLAVSRSLYAWLRADVFTGPTIYTELPTLLLCLGAFLVASSLVEWPMYFLATPRKSHRVRLASISVIVANIATSTLMLLLYFFIAPTSMLWRMQHDPSLAFVPDDTNARVYYLSTDGRLRSVELDGDNDMPVDGLPVAQDNWFIYPSTDGADTWSLHLAAGSVRDSIATSGPLQGIAPTFRSFWSGESLPFSHRFLRFGDLRPAGEHNWNFLVGVWGAEGLLAVRQQPPKRLRLALETPFVDGSVRDLTVIREGLVIFLVEPDQIVVADLDQGSMGVLARGVSAVTVLESGSAN